MPPASHASSVTPGSQAQPADFNQNQTNATTLFILIGQTMTKTDKDIHYLAVLPVIHSLQKGSAAVINRKGIAHHDP